MDQRAIFGDFQTPPNLAAVVCARLSRDGLHPKMVIEPTCGVGAFLHAAAASWPSASLQGFEINEQHLEQAKLRLGEHTRSGRLELSKQDFFDGEWDVQLAACPDQTLLLGNPPWVTNAALAAAGGINLPGKTNFQGLNGIAAKTGKANFDIAEWMLIRLVEAARLRPFTIAMLCKTATARKVLRDGWLRTQNIQHAEMLTIDADDWFGVSVAACLLIIKTGAPKTASAAVGDLTAPSAKQSIIGLAGKELVSDLPTYHRLRHLDGYSPFIWRSGIKHDCSDVMELRRTNDGGLVNGLGETVSMEEQFVFPLLKSSDVANGLAVAKKAVVVPQQRTGDDTRLLESAAPKTWQYLSSHADRLASRKSSIYRNRPPFSIFGIGDYSFSPWKIAVSALHRHIRFRLYGPEEGKAVQFDDTCYCLGFDTREQAAAVLEILDSEPCKQFISALTFTDAKRVVTAELLQRLNLRAIAEAAGLEHLWLQIDSAKSSSRSTEIPMQAALLMEALHRYDA